MHMPAQRPGNRQPPAAFWPSVAGRCAVRTMGAVRAMRMAPAQHANGLFVALRTEENCRSTRHGVLPNLTRQRVGFVRTTI